MEGLVLMLIDEAEKVLEIAGRFGVSVRLTFPYNESLWQALRDAGYLPVLEHTAWCGLEIVVSSPPSGTS